MSHNQFKQQGNILILSVIVMVVVGFLSLNLIKVETSNHDTVSKEILGTQAWFLAHSGAELGLVKLFPLDQPMTSCRAVTTMPNDELNKMVNAEPKCRHLDLSCVEKTAGTVTYFQIKSTATCGSGVNTVTRVQEVWAKEAL